MTTVAVFGAKGRMGREVVAAVEAAPDLISVSGDKASRRASAASNDTENKR